MVIKNNFFKNVYFLSILKTKINSQNKFKRCHSVESMPSEDAFEGEDDTIVDLLESLASELKQLSQSSQKDATTSQQALQQSIS